MVPDPDPTCTTFPPANFHFFPRCPLCPLCPLFLQVLAQKTETKKNKKQDKTYQVWRLDPRRVFNRLVDLGQVLGFGGIPIIGYLIKEDPIHTQSSRGRSPIGIHCHIIQDRCEIAIGIMGRHISHFLDIGISIQAAHRGRVLSAGGGGPRPTGWVDNDHKVKLGMCRNSVSKDQHSSKHSKDPSRFCDSVFYLRIIQRIPGSVCFRIDVNWE